MRHLQRGICPPGRDQPAGTAGAGGGPEWAGGHRRDPGPAAPAQTPGREGRSAGHPAGQGCGLLPPLQRGAADDRGGWLPALHPGGRHADAEGVRDRPGGEALRHRGPLQYRGKAPGHADAAGKRHCNRVPHQDAEFERGVPQGGHPGGRRRAGGPDLRRHGEGGGCGSGRGHEPQRGWKTVRRRGL